MKTLTIFTPAYNRKHTIGRTYESLLRQTCKDVEWLIIDDGSSDGTMDWVHTLGPGRWIEGFAYDWMGRRTNERGQYYVVDVPFADSEDMLHITYIYKPNGGLYTGYNVAYDHIQTELCVCIDSDDFAPDDMVEKVVDLWKKYYPDGSLNNKLSAINQKEYCGIIGLDFYLDKGTPIGGYFPEGMTETYRSDLFLKKIHCGDSKEVMRTELMRQVAPQIGFEGEKNFNPSYMLAQVWDKNPLLVINENLCNVEYQIGADSMSQGIYKQYVNSARSYAKHRIMHMGLSRYPYSYKFRHAAHYISSCILSHDKNWFNKSPMKLTTLLAIPVGVAIYCIIKIKTWKK